ncbi:hypothetical protein [Leifsonia xyli]|uniref:hypothetical protein n=1 Tax=Leifsonia xyli TaxID=1575 RepID=UPI000AB6C653
MTGNDVISTRLRGLAVVVAIGAAAVLTGCAGGVAGAAATSPAVSASPTTTSTPTAMPSATPAADPADPSTWLVTFEGIGPLVAGSELAAVPSELSAFTELAAPEEQCSAYVYRLADTLRASTSGGRTDHEHAVDVTVSWMGSSDAPGPSDVAASPRTERGIGVGSTIAELKAAYPDLAVTHGGDVPTYGITDGTRWILFRDLWAGGTVSAVQVGTSDLIPNEIC